MGLNIKKSYWCYIPVVITLGLGYFIGGLLSFGVMYLNIFPTLTDPTARFLLMVFGIGMLGATTFSSSFWANDIDEVVYENKNYEPHFFDFVGYLSMIIEGGLTGVVFYLLIKSGLIIATSQSDLTVNLPATVVIAYCGGLFHFEVINRLKKLAKDNLSAELEKK